MSDFCGCGTPLLLMPSEQAPGELCERCFDQQIVLDRDESGPCDFCGRFLCDCGVCDFCGLFWCVCDWGDEELVIDDGDEELENLAVGVVSQLVSRIRKLEAKLALARRELEQKK